MRFLVVLATLALLLVTPRAGAQNIEITPDGESYVLQFDETNGERLDDFIDLAQKVLLRPIKYQPNEVGETRIFILGPQSVRIADFYQYFQAVLKAYDFLVVDYGPPGSTFLSVQKVQSGGPRGTGGVKPQPIVIDVSEIPNYRNDPATLLSTSVPLKYIDARTANTTFTGVFDSPYEQVRAVENSNSVVFTAFGTSLWGAYQLVKLIDVPPFKAQPVIRKRVLVHASVAEIEQVLNDLLSAARGLKPGQTQAAAQTGGALNNEIEPRIIAENRGNSFLIAGSLEDVDRIENWIDVLDVEVEPRGNIHVYRLKNMRAADLVQTVQQVLDEERAAAQATRTSGSSGSAPASVTSTSGLEIQSSVVADSESNSLVITASDRKYAEIVEILRKLDVRRPQVLVEAAIVETTKTLNETIDIGIAAADVDSGAFVSNFGKTITGVDDAGMPDLTGALNAAVGKGGSFALFSGADLPIPLVLQALQTDVNNRVLSRPSLLTNDNQEAQIITEVETAYETSTVLQSGNESRSFETVTAGITLRISPTISAGNYLRLRVLIEVSDFQDPRSGVEGAPPDITRRQIETPVTIPDGHTVVLGGLVSKTDAETKNAIPWLSDLPVIGWLFKGFSDRSDDRYLYIFITPHIIDTDFALLDEISAARQFDYERLGGNIEDLSAPFGGAGTDADMRHLNSTSWLFEMPTTSFPQSGNNGYAPGGGAPMAPAPVTPTPMPMPTPVPVAPPSTPSFDDVFGTGQNPTGGTAGGGS